MMTSQEGKQLDPRMMLTVTKAEDRRKMERFFEEQGVQIWYQCRGKGTAPSEILDIFGLGGTTRLITISILPRRKVAKLFEAMAGQLAFRQKGGGIAISVPLTGLQSQILHLLKDEARVEAEKRMEERMNEDMSETKRQAEYVVIWASVSSGYSDDVIDAARAAGARGGTVIKGRRRNSERVSRQFGVSTQEEQDFVMIVAPKSKKGEILSSVSAACGLRTDAHGVVLSLPVEDVIGLEG